MKDLIERLANIEHERWSGWMRWEHRLDVTPEDRARWAKQTETAYADLPKATKELDRIEVRRTLAEIDKTHMLVPREDDRSQKRWELYVTLLGKFYEQYSRTDQILDFEYGAKDAKKNADTALKV